MIVRCDAELRWWMLMWDKMPNPVLRQRGPMTWFWLPLRRFDERRLLCPGTSRPVLVHAAIMRNIEWTPIPNLQYEHAGQVVQFSERRSGDHR